MEVQYFLEERTAFIRYYYDTAAAAFLDIHKKIENKQPPFDNPPETEDSEPPFLEEFGDAEDGLVVLGRTALSMLKQAMNDYFSEWEARLEIARGQEHVAAFKNGLFNGFRFLFETASGAPWKDSGADLDLLEQVVLVRNSEQHGTKLTSRHASHTKKDIEKYGDKLNFVSDLERKYRAKMAAGEEGFEEPLPFWLGYIEVSRDDLIKSTAELEKLVAFLEPVFNKMSYGTDSIFPVKQE